MQASWSADACLPSVGVETITLQSPDGGGLGFDIGGNAREGFVVQDVNANGVAGASGKIQAGDKISGIGVGMENLGVDDVRKILNLLAPYPIKLNVNKSSANVGAGFGISGPNIGVTRPNINIGGPSFGATGPNVDVRGPNIDVNANSDIRAGLPSANIDVQSPDVRFDAKAPSGNINLPGISSKGDAKAGIDVPLPQVDIEVPDVDIDAKGKKFGDKVKGFFGGGSGKKDQAAKIKGKIDVDAGADVSVPGVSYDGPNIHGGVDANLPSVEGDIKIKADKPDHESWFDKHKPKINFGRSGKYSVSDASANVDVNLPSVDVDAGNRQSVEIKGVMPRGDVQVPGVDFNAGNASIS